LILTDLHGVCRQVRVCVLVRVWWLYTVHMDDWGIPQWCSKPHWCATHTHTHPQTERVFLLVCCCAETGINTHARIISDLSTHWHFTSFKSHNHKSQLSSIPECWWWWSAV